MGTFKLVVVAVAPEKALVAVVGGSDATLIVSPKVAFANALFPILCILLPKIIDPSLELAKADSPISET